MPVRHILGSSALLLASLSLPSRSVAQAPTSLQTDATVLPRHKLGVRLLSNFSHFDEYLGDGGLRNIAFGLNTDSLTGAQIPQLGFTQTAIRTLTGNAGLAVSAGNIVASADSRIVTAPLIFEYGLTSRLTLGLVIPLVETRTTVGAQLNPKLGPANLGPNLSATSNWATNDLLVKSLRKAGTDLTALLASCRGNPSQSGCTNLQTPAQQATAQSLIDATTPFANALAAVYGTGESQPGTFFVPIQNGTVQAAIIARITQFRTQYENFGGSLATQNPAGAAGPGANNALQALLLAAGYDSLTSTDHSSIGDISIGANYQLANTFGDSARIANHGAEYRLAVNATARVGTGQPANRNKMFENATGYGTPGAIVGAAADLRIARRYTLTGLGSYTHNFGSIDVERFANARNAQLPLVAQTGAVTYSAGDVLSLTLIPRFQLARLLTVDGEYALSHVGADTYSGVTTVTATPLALAGPAITPYGMAAATAQQLGIGFTYSTIASNDRGPGRLPFEASYRHTQVISASGGPVPQTFADRVQLRVFFR